MEITCRYRSLVADHPVCQITSQLTGLPLRHCEVNDSACTHCLTCGVAAEGPNCVTASMAIGAARRHGDERVTSEIVGRFRRYLTRGSVRTTCVLRGPVVRRVSCKPCQAGSQTPVVVDVHRCPKHSECTLHNTGLHPRIQACATCADRLKKYHELRSKPNPPNVIAAVQGKRSDRRSPPL